MAEDADFFPGIPSEHLLPHLHSILILNEEPLKQLWPLKDKPVSSSTITEHSQYLKEAGEKVIAILKHIFKGDEIASKYALLNMISKVYLRQTGFILGAFNTNISGVDTTQAQLLSEFAI